MKDEKEDLTDLYDTLQQQLKEDREKILDVYNLLKDKVVLPEDFAINGMVLSKFAEIMIKQTAQLIEVIRINQREKIKEINLDIEDKKELFREIGN